MKIPTDGIFDILGKERTSRPTIMRHRSSGLIQPITRSDLAVVSVNVDSNVEIFQHEASFPVRLVGESENTSKGITWLLHGSDQHLIQQRTKAYDAPATTVTSKKI